MNYKLEKPNTSGITPREVFSALYTSRNGAITPRKETTELIQQVISPSYLYWDKVKYKKMPHGISHEQFWMALKFTRQSQMIKGPIRSESGDYFVWMKLPQLEQFLHESDLYLGGTLFGKQKDMEKKNKYHFISRGIMEEAIASSQLEGANTSRKAAKELLRSHRKPRTRSERMIFNNYKAMQLIEGDYKDRELDMDMLFELRDTVTSGTIPKEDLGRLRTNKDKIIVGDDDVIYHVPPKTSFLKKELSRLFTYANDASDDSFVHPVIKAIMLHFWVGYLHPFTDGNGRMARLLFYWYLIKHDYWAFTYLPISTKIKKSPGQYKKAYIYSEQDDFDLTYFIDYNIKKIEGALQDFREYVESKAQANLRMNTLAQSKYNLNERQIQLLQYLYQNDEGTTSLKTHMNVYQVSQATAFTDLKMAQKIGFLSSRKRGRTVYYSATKKVGRLFT